MRQSAQEKVQRLCRGENFTIDNVLSTREKGGEKHRYSRKIVGSQEKKMAISNQII